MLVLLLRNGFRVDRRKFVPFVVMVAVAVLLVSSANIFKAVVLASVWDPIARFDGGDIQIMKSEKHPVYTLTSGGLYPVCSRQLMTVADLRDLPSQYPATASLHIPGDASVNGTRLYLSVCGSQSFGAPLPRCSEGRLPDDSDAASVGSAQPVLRAAIFPESEALRTQKPGDRFQMTIPGIVPSGGAPNIMGVYEVAEGIDYLDYQHAVTVTVEVTGIISDGLAGVDRVLVNLRDLQRLTGDHQYINSAALSTGVSDIKELSRIGDVFEAELGDGFYALTVTDKMGLTGEISALEQHADRLMQMVFLICVLMVATVLVLIISYRRQQDAQLLFLGISRSALLGAVVIQTAVIGLCAVAIGLSVPVSVAVSIKGWQVLKGVDFGRYFTLAWASIAVAVLISLLMLPRKGETLEAMRNE